MSLEMHVPPPGKMTQWCSQAGAALGGVLGLLTAILSASADWLMLSLLSILLAPLAGAAMGLLLGGMAGFLLDFGASRVWTKEVERGHPVPTRAGGPRWGLSALPST